MNLNQYYIPSNIDLDELLPLMREDQMPERDRLGYTISYLVNETNYLRSKGIQRPWVYASSRDLRDINSYYSKHLEFLSEQGVLTINHNYIIDVSTKAYQLNPDYHVPFKREEFVSNRYRNHLARKQAEKWLKESKKKEAIPHLEKHLKSKSFQLDIQSAEKGLLAHFLEVKGDLEKESRAINALKEFDILHSKQFSAHRDDVSGRYHSPLTRMPKYARKFLTYNNQPLVSIDITNCQAYLFQVLFNKQLFANLLPNLKYFNRTFKLPQEFFDLQFDDLSTYYHSDEFQTSDFGHLDHSFYSYYLLQESVGTPVNTGGSSCIFEGAFSLFLKAVNGGEFYEALMDFSSKRFNKKLSRDEAKEAVFKILYTDNRWMDNQKKLFSEIFPGPFEMSRLVKTSELTRKGADVANRKVSKNGKRQRRSQKEMALERKRKRKTALAVLLQNIESYIMLDCVCKRIIQEQPHIPIFTIHDCIASTEEHIPQILKILTEEFEKHIGVKPPYAIENWG